MEWPDDKTITVRDLPGRAKAVSFLANGKRLEFSQKGDNLIVMLPPEPHDELVTVIKVNL